MISESEDVESNRNCPSCEQTKCSVMCNKNKLQIPVDHFDLDTSKNTFRKTTTNVTEKTKENHRLKTQLSQNVKAAKPTRDTMSIAASSENVRIPNIQQMNTLTTQAKEP